MDMSVKLRRDLICLRSMTWQNSTAILYEDVNAIQMVKGMAGKEIAVIQNLTKPSRTNNFKSSC